MSRVSTLGRHETGQNFLSDASVIAEITAQIARTRGPIVELGAGDGALTRPLARLSRQILAIELDPRRARRLDAGTPSHVRVLAGDVLRAAFPDRPHVVVGNVPFHLTTAILRRLFAERCWTDAVLLVQWEVARRRAGVGGSTMLTAQEWPWFEFQVLRRVPARAFRPIPSVDGGLLRIVRRAEPLVPVSERREYQRFVGEVFTGAGSGLPAILRRVTPTPGLDGWLRASGVTASTLPKHLDASQWASLWESTRRVRRTGRRSTPPGRM
jgi:23S rRNA (adenine-N6)-dimethyltransferase